MRLVVTTLIAGTLAAACTPTVKIEAPDKPIRIDLNIKIDQEVRVKLEPAVEELIQDNPELF